MIQNNTMDPELWSNLQHHISLETVYLKLPLREFFQLRGVCKDWNRLARERRCPTDPIHRPYFLLVHEDTEDLCYNPLHGILTFHISSGRWRWNRLPAISYYLSHLFKSFSVKGLTFSSCHKSGTLQIFDAHIQKSYIVPQARNHVTAGGCAAGMAVDTTVIPHTFKIILGSADTETQVFDSVTNSWETRSSRLVSFEAVFSKSCLHCGDHVYIWSKLGKILVYALQEDIWSLLDPIPRHETEKFLLRALGSWRGRLLALTEQYARGLSSLSLWELVDRSKQEWSIFAHLPGEMHDWLVPSRFQGYIIIPVFANFCNEFVLVYTLVGETGRYSRSKKLVLLNLATMHWEKVEIASTVFPNVESAGEADAGQWDYNGFSFSEDRQDLMTHWKPLTRCWIDFGL